MRLSEYFNATIQLGELQLRPAGVGLTPHLAVELGVEPMISVSWMNTRHTVASVRTGRLLHDLTRSPCGCFFSGLRSPCSCDWLADRYRSITPSECIDFDTLHYHYLTPL